MVKVRGGLTSSHEAAEKCALRRHIDLAVAGKTNLTDDEILSHLLAAYPQTYSHLDRDVLKERVVKTPLWCRGGTAASKLAAVINKRRNPSGENAASSSSSISVRSSEEEEEDDSSDSEETEDDDDQPESDECESDECGDGRRRASRRNRLGFKDLVMADSVIQELIREVIRPLRLLKVMRHLGIEPAPRILLHGPPGCGKTTLARAIAKEARVPFYEVSAAALVSGVSDAPEENIRKLFSKAHMRAPSVVLIDDIDVMTSKTESSQKEVVAHLVNYLMACIDEPYSFIKPVNDNDYSRTGYVLVIASTSRPDFVDPALRQRFDREIVIAAPDEKARLDILSALTRDLKVEVGFNLATIARCTLGFVGGDLVSLVKKAGTIALNRIMDRRMKRLCKKQRVDVQVKDRYRFSDEKMGKLSITIEDFLEAGKIVQPSSKIECFSITPKAKWNDVGGRQDLKSEFELHIISRIKFPEAYKDLGVSSATIFFLYGPTGCGKTFMVEALANEAGAKLIHIKGPELVKEYGDQADFVVRLIFQYARTCSPCILFFDEVDAITLCCENEPLPIFRQFLIELNDAKQSGVYVISATNRPETTHISLARGMYDKLLYVSFPGITERGEILKALARNKPIDANVDLMALAEDLPAQFTPADLSALMKAAAKTTIDRHMRFGIGCSLPMPWTINDADFKSALKKISPSGSRTQDKNCGLFYSDQWYT